MTLIRYEPWNVLDRLHRQVDQIFGDSFAAPAAAGDSSVTWIPSVDVQEESDKFIVRADLPGVESKDISITADNRVLTLRGERHFERKTNQKGFERLERIEGAFLRRFTLPNNVQDDQIKARHVNGVLEVTIPKVPAPEPRRVSVEAH
ncbi:MAG: Hsp20/alpha crystallin family protein [Steroidobacteraceae bacterium]|jgi:HSP20 family protein